MTQGDQPVRWMASVYAKEIIEEACQLLLEEAHPIKNSDRTLDRVDQIERLIPLIRFNLKSPKK